MAKTPEKAAPVETVTYTTEQANKILDYLGSRPYKEVAQLVQILQSGKVGNGQA